MYQQRGWKSRGAGSYTHLTMPTNRRGKRQEENGAEKKKKKKKGRTGERDGEDKQQRTKNSERHEV